MIQRLFFITAMWFIVLFPFYAFEEFTIKNIEIVGLQRISIGTVLNYLPLDIGDRMNEKRSAEAITALFSTEFFDDVSLGFLDDTLVVIVVELRVVNFGGGLPACWITR